jgi:hypothetical protein
MDVGHRPNAYVKIRDGLSDESLGQIRTEGRPGGALSADSILHPVPADARLQWRAHVQNGQKFEVARGFRSSR